MKQYKRKRLLYIKMGVFRIQSIPWYDTHEQGYYNALSINAIPTGILADHIQSKSKPRLSPFETKSYCHEEECPLLIFKRPYDRNPICVDEYDWLLGFLIDNGYSIDYDMTNMVNKSKISNQRNRTLCFFRD